MDEFDSLLDSLIEQRNAPEISYIGDRYVNVLKVKNAPSKGEGVFADQLLSVKNPICTLRYPTMMAIDSTFLSTTCYYCLALTASPLPIPKYGCDTIDLRTCNGCNFARFCNQDCQLRAWIQFHKYECKIFKRTQHNLLPAIVRAIIRIVLLKDRDLMGKEEWSRITRLISHEHILTARGRSNLTDMAEGIKHLAESKMSIQMIQKLIFIMRNNATELPTPIHGGIGVMLDPLMAKFNHSCEPNITIYRPQNTMTSGWIDSARFSEDERHTFAYVVPLRDIQEGEELLNCYVVPTASVKDRKATFMADYLFDCDCSKCLSDTEDAAKLAHEQPGTTARFSQWSKDVKRSISNPRNNPQSIRKAAAAMNRSEQLLEYPTLYTTGNFPNLAMELVLEALKAQAYEEALVNVLRLYFLVNPERFVGRHNPTNIYTIFLTLTIFDVILGKSSTTGNANDKKDRRPREVSASRFSPRNLVYWRHRIRADLRTRLERSAMKDLICLLTHKHEEGVSNTMAQDRDTKEEMSGESAEREMAAVLKLNETRWRTVLEKAGC